MCLLAAAQLAAAQETTGTITGRIVDSQGLPVPGATVSISGAQGTHTTTTGSDGRFAVPFLTPGVYDVHAELQGFKAADTKGNRVSLGQTLDLQLTMQVGAVSETVNVTGAPTVIDTRSTTTGAVLDAGMMERVPVGRTVSSVLYMAPGVQTGGSVGSANPSISGGSGLENQYVIDGVNVTNMGYGALGSYSGVFGSLGNATPFDFVQEIQVKTGGYEAEFGQSTGGVVNVVTKSGSNAFHGGLFGTWRPSKLESAFTQVQSVNGTINTVSTHASDAGADLSGPIVKEKLFFFAAIDPSWTTSSFVAPPGPKFPLNALGAVDRERRSVPYSAKGTYQISSGQRIDASFFGDPSDGPMGLQRITALLNPSPTAYSQLTYGGHNQTVRYSGVLTNRLILEGAFARAHNSIVETPSVDAWQVIDRTVSPQLQTGGIGYYEQGNTSNNDQWWAKASYVAGGHQIRAGYEFDNVTFDWTRQYSGPTFTAPNGRQTQTGASVSVISDPTFGRIFRVTRANFTAARDTTQKYQSGFIQDQWRIGTRLTINPGLRYEQEAMSGTIITDYKLKNNWAPRIGATYDFTGTGKSKVFGNFGIFYARVPNDLAARALSADDGLSRADYFDANLTTPVPEGVLAGGQTRHFIPAGLSVDTIDPNTKLSYVREFVLGAEREIAPNTTVGLRWINRRIPRVLEDVANCPMAAYDLSAATAAVCGSVEYILTNPSSAIPVNPDLIAIAPQFASVRFDDPVHKYDAVELTFNRRLSNNWSMIASYRYSRLRGNFEGFYRDDNGQSDPGISSLYDFPTNDPTYTSLGGPLGYEGDIRYLGDPNGILPLDRPHQAKLFGNYVFPFGLNIGASINATSGKPLTPLASNPNYTNGGEIPTAARGSGIQTVDGFMTRTPFLTQTDLQAAYDIKLGGAGVRRISLLADVFNIFNQQTVLDYDNWVDLSFGAGPNPDFGKPISQVFGGRPPQYQTPRQVRFSLRFQF